MKHAVIMAGGKGTRFWPLSREKCPKQLLKIVGERTMIQATVDRVGLIVPHENILVITGALHLDEITSQLPELPNKNIIAEPVGRNTAPCIALAAMVIKHRDPDAVIGVFPADHVMTKPDEFVKTAKALFDELEKKPDMLATMGIKPSYPETGYGYIRRGVAISGSIYSVSEFCEKPDKQKASEYVKGGEHYWNSGMFFWKVSAILNELNECLPDLMSKIAPIENAIGSDRFDTVMKETYPSLPSISIDYGVMEKAGAKGKALVAVADPGWNDVGSWRSLYDLMEADDTGARKRGQVVTIDSKGTLVHNEKRLVAVVGLDDIIVVETDDAILICHKDRAQEVRDITGKLKDMGLGEFL
ncbi:Mannose-1-phosphate guanylyltransferase [hydrothermal vent metagenome]|uniref:Mannose-1-phosphate guanylyltransferase n=1 Tax=hydrothermal vent metagenome TaxID=652676 RepID=A0A3B1CBR6_9ZZZZ